jgi:Fic family protein
VLQEILNDDKNTFTVSLIERKFEVSNQTARNDLNQLVEDGILQSRKNGKQMQFIPAPGSIKKIRKQAPENGRT